MSKAIRALFLTTAVLILGSSAGAQEVVKRKPGESLQTFAKRVIPPKTDLVHPVVEGKFGGFAHAVVLFFDNTDKLSAGFTGWVLALNATLDLRRMSWPLKILALFWLLLVSWLAIQTLRAEFTFDRRWSPR